MRKIVASVSLMMCLSASASAMDYRVDGQSPLFTTVGWEQENVKINKQSTSALREQLKNLEKENEQLRNSINRMMGSKQSTKIAPDSRIQALVEENKRLTKLLNQKSVSAPTSDDVYARKIASLKNENQKLLEQVNGLSGQASSYNASALQAYKKENALLKEALNQRDNGAERIVALQKQIQRLQDANKALQKNQVQRASLNAKESEIQAKSAKIQSLQGSIKQLQAENQKLKLSAADMNKKALSEDSRADKAMSAYKNNLKALEILQERLAKAQQDNKKLKAKAAGISENSYSKEQFLAVQKQNKSLRDTIKAQNASLVSSDNAAQAAERLLSENAALKRKLELADKSSSANGQTAKDILERNKKLQFEIVQRDNYIEKLEGLKDTVKQLREANDRYAMGQGDSQNSKKQISELLGQKDALQVALDQERDNTIVYRTKIKEYQDIIAELKNDNSAQDDLQKERSAAMALRLENQELKARIDLLSEKTKSVVFQKETSYKESKVLDTNALLRESIEDTQVEFSRGTKEIVATSKTGKGKQVKFIDTEYPPVDQVAPILNMDGERMDGFVAPEENIETSSVENMADDPVVKSIIKPEDLLAQELSPLDDK